MSVRYAHTNIISQDWKKLTDFYIQVFDCRPIPPQRNQSGGWLEKGTGVKNAHLQGMHLLLPGHGDSGPTLEIYSYGEMIEKNNPPMANRKGLGHLAFEVENVDETVQRIISLGGKKIGDIVKKAVKEVGMLTFVYAADPEGNIIEVQNWQYSS
ncbi:VOC family protein [Candidatus Gracilibacteria bacterium]|nr:VOC family protein [Candidatus Gracilibacteria bacterium]